MPTHVPALQTVKPDFSNFDDNAAWPFLLDEFVELQKNKMQA